MIKKLLNKKIIIPLVLILLIGIYFSYQSLVKKQIVVQYITATVEKGTLIASVEGSGQVSVSDQVDIKPKVSGDIVYVGVKKGQETKTNTILAKIDTTDAEKAVRDAETSLETAKLELEELLKPVDELTLLQAENSLTQAKESKEKAEDSLLETYEEGFNTVVSTFADLPTIMSDLEDILYGNDINRNQDNISAYADMVRAYDEKIDQYKEDTLNNYQSARTAYDENFQNYKLVSRYSDNATIEALIDETYETAKKIAETIKNTDNLLSSVRDVLTQRKMNISAILSTHQRDRKSVV